MTAPTRVLATRRGWLALLAVAAGLTAYGLAPGLRWHILNMRNCMRDIYDHRNSTLESRARTIHGTAWQLMQLAREQTPPTARILLPSGAEHSPLSNRLWCAYYLYPRHLLQEKDLRGPLKEQADFVLVDKGWGLKLAGFPADSIRGDESGVLEAR